MLTGKMVRVRVVRNQLTPLYLPTHDRHWRSYAELLIATFREATGLTRGELSENLERLRTGGGQQLIEEGLAKLLEDRCTFEVVAETPPETIREAVFRLSAQEHQQAALERRAFRRDEVLARAAEELQLTSEQIDRSLFADLQAEQRIETFEPLSAEALLSRYNVALAQAVLLRATELDVRLAGESAARFRQLFRSLKFHRLLAQIRAADGAAYQLRIQGPMALFQSTQKYGLQLAMFLPSLLLCKQFEAKAQVLWGPQKKPKQFVLRSSDGLRSHLPDFGVYTPPELQQFLVNFREQIGQWAILEEPAPQLLDSSVWVPDFTLRHHRSGATIFVEFVGYWRQVDLESHLERLERRLPGQYLLLVAESHRADEGSTWPTAGGIYRYKRTPIVAEVAKLAGQIAGVI